ncbi:FtsJ-like methyltransferase-domain-containing protein [Dipodascopsis uninucleata]
MIIVNILMRLPRLWPTNATILDIYSLRNFGLFDTNIRWASSASSRRWNQRQKNDFYYKDSKAKGLRSRAAYKLLELDFHNKIFKEGQTVVDLGFAPGSWTQVAVDRTYPSGRVIGVDLLPCAPPRGASAIQGDFLNNSVQELLKQYLADDRAGTVGERYHSSEYGSVVEEVGYIDLERTLQNEDSKVESAILSQYDGSDSVSLVSDTSEETVVKKSRKTKELDTSYSSHLVDVILSDMSAPWVNKPFIFWSRTLSEPYFRMMNTSGNSFRDHAKSMDLCNAALAFALDTLKDGGSFVCKFYAGSEDQALEKKIRQAFNKVKRDKPKASRSESREHYFVASGRKKKISKQDIFGPLYDF